MAKVTNISTGPRGAYNKGVLVFSEPGETIEADDFAEEWFAAGDDGIDGLKKADLVALAEAEGVAIETDDNRADLIRKIQEHREQAGS